MIKIIGSHSMKVPSTEAYSSKGFAVSLEIEVADTLDGKAILQKTRQIFQLARTAVNNELRNGHSTSTPPSLVNTSNGKGNGPVHGNNHPPQGYNNNPNGNNGGPRTQNGGQRNASPKQIKYVLSLAKKNGGYKALQDYIQSQYGIGDINSLTKKQASELIEGYKNGGGEHGGE